MISIGEIAALCTGAAVPTVIGSDTEAVCFVQRPMTTKQL
jgi:hypothetical protein